MQSEALNYIKKYNYLQISLIIIIII